MKKILMFSILSMFAFALMAQGPGEQRAKNKAEAAARACLSQSNIPAGVNIHSAATVLTICDYMNPNPNYFGYRVVVWATPNCPPNQPCIQIVYPLATVEVSCTGQVVDVQCDVVGQ